MSFKQGWLKSGLPTFHVEKDKGRARVTIDRLGGPDGFKTAYRTDPDGTVTITQTKGSMPPQVTVQKRTAGGAPTTHRTFVFNYKNATVGTVANKGATPGGMKVLTANKSVARASYGVASFKTKLGGGTDVKWNDVWRLDRTPYTGGVLFTINGTPATPLNARTVEDKGYSAIPFVVSTDGVYASVLNTTPPILPLFIGYSQPGLGHGVVALKPSGKGQETIKASISSTTGCAAGLRSTVDGTFGFLGGVPTPGSDDADTLTAVTISWATIRATSEPPYLALLAGASSGQSLGALPALSELPSTTTVDYDPGGYTLMPVYGRLVVRTFPWDFNPLNTNTTPPYWPVEYTYACEDPSSGVIAPSGTSTLLKTTEHGRVSKRLDWGMGDDTGGLRATFTVDGQFSYQWWNGKITQASQYEADAPISYSNTMYDGEEYRGESHSATSLVLRTQSSVPEPNLLKVDVTIDITDGHKNAMVTDDFGVAEYGITSSEGQLGYYYPPGKGWPEQPATFISLEPRTRYGGPWHHYGPPVDEAAIAYANAQGAANKALAEAHAGEVYPVHAYPLRGLYIDQSYVSTTRLVADTRDYVYVDDVEGVYIYLETNLTYSVTNSTVMSVTTRVPSWSLTARYVVESRFGGAAVDIAVNAAQEPHFQILTPFSSDPVGRGQYLTKYHSNFIPPPLFTPVFRSQGNCPHIAYTTLAEESAGATPEFYLDMAIQARKYSTIRGSSIYGEFVEFIPHQFVHIYQRYLKNVDPQAVDDRNLRLFDAMFPSPVRIQITNGQVGAVQVGLDLAVVTPEISRT